MESSLENIVKSGQRIMAYVGRMSSTVPQQIIDTAIKHKISLGRDIGGYHIWNKDRIIVDACGHDEQECLNMLERYINKMA